MNNKVLLLHFKECPHVRILERGVVCTVVQGTQAACHKCHWQKRTISMKEWVDPRRVEGGGG